MRKVLLGLIGAALIVSAAQTAPVLGCKLDGLELIEEPVTSASRRFRVLKVESHFWRLHGPELNDFKPDGYVKVLIEGGDHRYVILQTFSRHGFPANSGMSADATPERIRQINPKRRSPAGERARVNGLFYILGGPLGDEAVLTPVKCR